MKERSYDILITNAVLVRKIDKASMNVKEAPLCKGSLFFTSRERIKEDRERKTFSILLSVGNVFYWISKSSSGVHPFWGQLFYLHYAPK